MKATDPKLDSTAQITGAATREVTAEQLRQILEKISFSDSQVEAVRALAPHILDKAGAAAVITDVISFSDAQAAALYALNGQTPPTEEAKGASRTAIQNPTLTDRFAGLAYGLTKPLRAFIGVAIVAVLGAWAFELVGVPLSQIPVLNFLSQMSGITGFGADFLAAFTGTAATTALVGGVSGFSDPTRSGAHSAAVGANVGSK